MDYRRPRVRLLAHGFREAVTMLDGYRPRTIDLTLGDAIYFRLTGIDRRDDISFFPRFVTLLGQQQENGSTIRHVALNTSRWSELPVEDMERLFGDVLPNHRTLEDIGISISHLPPRFLQMLTDNVPTAQVTTLSTLTLLSDSLPAEIQTQVARAIADMLNRDAAIEHLSLSFSLDSHQCRLICQAMRRNKKLRILQIRVREVGADMLNGVAGSSLQFLLVSGAFAERAVPLLASQLRTNETLQTLGLVHFGGNGILRGSHALFELMRTYNHSLAALMWRSGSDHEDARVHGQFEVYSRRNALIDRVLHHPGSFRRQLLPRLLEVGSDVPTALYRALKRWYVKDLVVREDGDDDRRHHL